MNTPALKGIRILAELNDSQLDKLSSYGEILPFAPGQLIVKQGQAADSMFFLLAGRVGTYATDRDGNETHLRTIESGSHFGEMGLLQGGSRTASVRAVTQCQVFRLGKDGFKELLKSQDLAVAFLYGLSRSMALRLADITCRFSELHSLKEAMNL